MQTDCRHLPDVAELVTLEGAPRLPIRFSVGTLVSSAADYDRMVQSFISAGFDPSFTEFLYIDNMRGNSADAYAGLNAIVARARGDYVVLCHQDVLLRFDRCEHLEARIRELEARSPGWAVLGNAGGWAVGHRVARISDPNGANQSNGPFPQQVMSVDENFIVLRRSAGLGFSADLTGFHFYGTDICLQALVRGRTAHVVDFHLEHLSAGRRDGSFFAARARFIAKYRTILSPRFIQTSTTVLFLGGSRLASLVLNARSVGSPLMGARRACRSAAGRLRRLLERPEL